MIDKRLAALAGETTLLEVVIRLVDGELYGASLSIRKSWGRGSYLYLLIWLMRLETLQVSSGRKREVNCKMAENEQVRLEESDNSTVSQLESNNRLTRPKL